MNVIKMYYEYINVLPLIFKDLLRTIFHELFHEPSIKATNASTEPTGRARLGREDFQFIFRESIRTLPTKLGSFFLNLRSHYQ